MAYPVLQIVLCEPEGVYAAGGFSTVVKILGINLVFHR